MPNNWQFKTEIKDSEIHGHGRFAMEDIPKGKTVVTLEGPALPKEQAPRKMPVSDTHNMNCEDTFVNHDKDANLTLVDTKITITVEKTFVSTKKIKKGSELTMNYEEFAKGKKFLF